MAESKRVPDAPTANLDVYLQALRQSGLVESAPLEKALAEFHTFLASSAAAPAPATAAATTPKKPRDPADGSALGRFLIGKNLITAWQHRMILEGRFRGFFLGRYRLLRLLGAGGMSQVYLAEHTRMHRRVAIKVLSTKLTREPGHLERFLVEARAIAALDHPNIIHAYNVDNDGGVYYLVMQYVEGHDLSRIVEVRGPLLPERAGEFIRQAAEGLAHAHARGLIHRDVKPGNLMVDRTGTVKIADLGLALQLDLEDTSLTRLLGQGLLGTTDYLAPEQALDCHNVDARADIYSLGCTLYFLLTGRPPFHEGTMAQRLMKHQSVEPASIYTLRADAPYELVTICSKMMAKKPEDRFQNCRAVCTALSRWIAARNAAQTAIQRAEIPEAILAEGSSQSISQVLLATVSPEDDDERESLEKSPTVASPTVASPRKPAEPTIVSATTVADLYERRRKKALIVNLSLCAAAALTVSVGLWIGVTRLSVPAADQATASEAKGEKGWIVFDWPSTERNGAKLLLDGKPVLVPAEGAVEVAAEPGSHSLMIVRPGFPIYERSVTVVSSQRRSVAPWWGGLDSPEVAITPTVPTPVPAPPAPPASVGPLLTMLPAAPLSALDRLTAAQIPAELSQMALDVPLAAAWGDLRLAHWTPVRTLAMSPQGNLVSVSQDAQFRLWNSGDGQKLAEWSPSITEFAQVVMLEFHPEGKLLASVEVPANGKYVVRLRNTSNGGIERTLAEGATTTAITFLPGGDALVTAATGGALQWWNSVNGQAGPQVATPFTHVRHLSASSSGKWLAVSGLVAAKAVSMPAKPAVAQAAVAVQSDTAKSDTAKSESPEVKGAESRTARIVRSVPKAVVVILDAATREVKHTLETDGQIMALRFAGETLVTAGSEGKLRQWNVETGEMASEFVAHAGPVTALAVDTAGKKAATFGGPGALIRVWDLTTCKQICERLNPSLGHVPQRSFEFTPDGQSLVFASWQECRISKLHSQTLEPAWPTVGHDASVMSAVWQSDGRLASADVRGRVFASDAATGGSTPLNKTSPTVAASPSLISPRGEMLATMGSDQSMRLIEMATGETKATIGPGMLLLASPTGWSFSPDGGLLAASWYSVEAKGFTLSVWNGRTGLPIHTTPTAATRVVSLAFSADGKFLATASQNAGKHEVTLYDTAQWKAISTFSGHANLIYNLAFSADGARLATASLDGTARLWKLPEGTPLASLPHESPVVAVDISSDGSRLATLARHGALKIWVLSSSTNTLVPEKTHLLFPAGSPTQFMFGPGASPVQRMFFAPDGRHVTVTCANGAIYVIRAAGK